jgi:HK97 family phage prohead protease
MKYDFSGWATRNNIKCSDGRTILKDAFKQHDGQTVPLVWNHQHNESANVLGHAVLENRDEGVYAYCTFNDTEAGKNAKLLVEHGDVTALSIYANQLKQKGSNVMHGTIREVSLVLAGANPGAFIDSVIRHGEFCEDEVVIYTGEELTLQHADDPSDKADEKDKKGDDEVDNNEKTIKDVVDSMSEEQKNVLYALVGQALEGKEMAQSAIEENENNIEEDGGEQEMKHNVFEGKETENNNVLSHDAMETILKDAKRYGSLKESFLAHADSYGIKDIEWLFPDAKNVNTPPDFIKRDDSYVQKVMRGVHHVPFSRIKSMFADITADQARAKGYIKGNLKKEEVFTLLKRTTTPTTIYKKQKLDRDDVVDITDFDVVAWLKMEMRMMLDEEIARAILVGDGRSSSDDDKINEMNIRPISRDEDLYCVKAPVAVAAAATEDEIAKAFIRTVIKSRKEYKGSGSPTLFTTEDVITNCLLLEDKNGRVIYDTVDKLATALRVKEIVPVEVMENAKTMVNKVEKPLMAIMVNLVDYYVGADKGGAINMFDDFDIDYNQQKYLMETRCSGALVKPFSAIAVALDQAAAAGGTGK